MKRVIRIIARLYPAPWRDRYASEFEALLEDLSPNWWDVLDVLKGALVMQIRCLGVIAASFAFLGALVAGLVSLRIPPTYSSSAVLRFQAAEPADADATRIRVEQVVEQALSEDSLAALVKEEKLYNERERDGRSMHELIRRMGHAIRIIIAKPIGNPAAATLKITFDDEDWGKAQRVTQGLIGLIEKANAARPTSATTTQLEIIAPPTLLTSPISPNPVVVIGGGLVVGLLLGVLVALVRRHAPRVQV
jgi:LPS O-antigen subunit length determinant protein (WzzB/FepE family)